MKMKSLSFRVVLGLFIITLIAAISLVSLNTFVRLTLKDNAIDRLAEEASLGEIMFEDWIEDGSNIKDLQYIVETAKLGHNAYYTFADKEGVVVAHPNKDLIGNGEILKKIGLWGNMRGKRGTTEYVYNDAKKLSYHLKLDNGWTMIIAITEADLYSEVNKIRWFSFAIGIGILVISAIISLTIRKMLRVMITHIREFSDDLADNVITTDVHFGNSTEGMGISNVISIAMGHLSSSIIEAKDASEKSFNSMRVIDTSIGNSMKTISEIELGVNEISKGNVTQAESTISIAEESSVLSETVGEIREMSTNIKSSVDKVHTSAEQAMQSLEEVSAQLKNSKESTELVSKESLALQENSKRLIEVTKIIEHITTQINLLALNAAIEAARSGDAGKGFSVIASEISSLAKSSEESISSISDTIELMVSNINSLSVSITEVDKISEENVTQNESMISDIEGIFSKISSIKDTTDLIETSIGKVSDSSVVVNEKVTELSSLSEEVSSMTEEILASLSSVVSDFTGTTEMVRETSDSLDKSYQTLTKFKISQ